jgi:aminoglycoside 6'-N-acetyltransferase I
MAASSRRSWEFDVQIVLCHPTTDDRTVIKNLFVFYRYDLMPFIDAGEGAAPNRFGAIASDNCPSHDQGVADQEIWWTRPQVLLPMLIRVDGAPAGFVMVAKPPHAHPSVDYRIEDFFILNRWRRTGVGHSAAAQLFDRYRGNWELGWLPRNTAAAAFWRSIVSRLHLRAEEWSVGQEPGTTELPGLRLRVDRR